MIARKALWQFGRVDKSRQRSTGSRCFLGRWEVRGGRLGFQNPQRKQGRVLVAPLPRLRFGLVTERPRLRFGLVTERPR